MSFKVCVIGCGHMSSFVHGPSFREYARRNSDTLLAGCCDLSLERAEEYREKFEFKTAYTDYVEMFEEEKPDAVCLISHVSQTKALSIDIMKRGYPVIMEKPPGLTASECTEIINASREYNVPARVAFNRRYQPLVKKLKNMLDSDVHEGGIYNIYYNMLRRNRFDEDFSTTTIHAIDTVRFISGSDYKYVNIDYQHLPAYGENVANIYIDGMLKSGARIRLEFVVASGAGIERCIVNGYNNTFLLNTPQGTDSPGKLVHIKDGEILCEITGEDEPEFYIAGGFYDENAEFFDLVKKGDLESISDVESGFQSVAIAECIRNRVSYFNGEQI